MDQGIFDRAVKDDPPAARTPDLTIREARAEFKRNATGKEHIGHLYVWGDDAKFLGRLGLRELLMAGDESALTDVMTRTWIDLNPNNTLKEAHQTFARYNLRALPVVDENGSMLGVLSYRDVANLRHRYLRNSGTLPKMAGTGGSGKPLHAGFEFLV